MKNVEFKAELRDPTLAAGILRTLGARFTTRMRQTDTYYRVVHGRLKKRETQVIRPAGSPDEPVEVIYYQREDALKPKISDFTIYTESEAAARFGPDPLPVWVVVTKTRSLYMLGPTRIHLDEVEGLGAFVEFESMVSSSNPEQAARRHNEELRAALAHVLGEPLAMSYSDLLAAELERARAARD
ncbi:MAG: class IV adenylate cyclase [Phycisphaerales bacterium JB040]